jgi:hypothetical protein
VMYWPTAGIFARVPLVPWRRYGLLVPDGPLRA